MNNKEHIEKVDSLFTSIAARYDLINDIQSFGLHRLWKQRIVKMASLIEGEDALDICCGTADLTLRLVKRNARVIGLDMNRPMLNVALNQLSRLESISANLLQADALDLPFNTSSFDLVTIAYGLRNVSDYQVGLLEVLRVCLLACLGLEEV